MNTSSVSEYFRERARRADRNATQRILERAGKGEPPMPGDELTEDGSRSDSDS